MEMIVIELARIYRRSVEILVGMATALVGSFERNGKDAI